MRSVVKGLKAGASRIAELLFERIWLVYIMLVVNIFLLLNIFRSEVNINELSVLSLKCILGLTLVSLTMIAYLGFTSFSEKISTKEKEERLANTKMQLRQMIDYQLIPPDALKRFERKVIASKRKTDLGLYLLIFLLTVNIGLIARLMVFVFR